MVDKLPTNVTATRVPSFPTSSSTTTSKATVVANTSIAHLKSIEGEAEGVGAKMRKSVGMALLGFALATSVVTPALADSLQPNGQTGTTQGLFLDASELERTRYGDTNYNKLLGTTPTSLQGVQQASVEESTKAAFGVFEARLSQILQRDAGSLAAGLRPLQSGDLTADQQKNLQRAFSDLVQNVPIGSFSPQVQNGLESILGALGNNRDLSTTTLKQFGKLGGDAASQLAKDVVKDFKNDHPAAFWSLASAGATAAVVVGYTQGTEGLAKLGIKPEIKTRIFDDVKLKVGIEAGKQLSNLGGTVGLEGQHTFGSGTVIRGGIEATVRSKEFAGGKVTAGITTTTGFNADGMVRLDGSGKPFEAKLSASQTFQLQNGQGVLFANGNYADGSHGTTKQATLSGGVLAQHGPWTTSVAANYDFHSDTFSSSLSTGRSFSINRKNDLDLQIRGSVDNRGAGYIGVGVNFSF